MQQLSVSALMQDCSTAVVAETALLRDAAEALVTHGYPALVVQNECGEVTGIVAESNVIRTLMTNSCRSLTVGAVQSRHVETVRESAEIRSVLHLFRSSCHAFIPVVNKDRAVVGILHRADIVRMLLSETQEESDASGASGVAAPKPKFMQRRPPTIDSESDRNGDEQSAG